jgi:hypothetical protein
MIKGQSNLAAGATVGSNHNSRGADGEIVAGRGFWPGLSSTLKHNCRFASFVLIAKGNYPFELNVPLPFSLLTTNAGNSRRELMPAYWWRYNMFALERNAWKFRARDQRKHKTQHIEMDYLAPDTVAEIISALNLLEKWGVKDAHGESIFVPERTIEKSGQPVRIIKPEDGVQSYREMLLYYGVKTLLEYFDDTEGGEHSDDEDNAKIGVRPDSFLQFQEEHREQESFDWVNLGGQLAPKSRVESLIADIVSEKLSTWEAVHAEYDWFWEQYPLDKALNALQVLRYLEGSPLVTPERWTAMLDETLRIRRFIEEQVYKTNRKDYSDPFRNITYRNAAERDAVLGKLEDNSFVESARAETKRIETLIAKAR